MNPTRTPHSWGLARLLALTLPVFAATAAFAQSDAATSTSKDDTMKLEKYTVTGSFIPQATAEPIAPVAIFSEADIRATGATTPIQALRNLPSFVSSGPNSNENDSNGGNGSAFVSIRGQGAGQTLVLLDGRPANNFTNIQLIPIEAIERIEVLRDGAGIIYGSAAIGGAVNVILKKNFSGMQVNLTGGGATRNPGSRDTFQGSFVAGVSNDKTSVIVAGSYFKNRTLYAGDRANSAIADNRRFGGTNGGSPTFAGNITAGGNPLILNPSFGTSATPASLADYIPMDQNTFSSNQLFNFRKFSPSAPGQKRNSLYFNIDQKVYDKSLQLFANFLYSKISTLNGLAPAPFALTMDNVGAANGDVTTFGPYNQGLLSSAPDTDLFRYRSVELGNRSQEQVFNSFRYMVGLRGEIGNTGWNWETSYYVDDQIARQLDAGVPSLPLLDAEIQAGRFNPFALAFSKGTATIGGITYNWDNAKALKAAEIHARQTTDSLQKTYDARVTGKFLELPAGPVGVAAGYEYNSGTNRFDPDSLYATGSVLGLNQFGGNYTESSSRAEFAEVKVPLIAAGNKLPWAHNLSIGGLARRESQTVKGTNSNTKLFDSRTFTKTNPNVNLQYSPTEDYKVRATWSKGFLAPGSGNLFGAPGQSNPTINDPLGFPTLAQQTIVIRGNPELKPAISKAWSLGFVARPKDFVKNLSFTVDFYNIKVDGIVANNADLILAANAAGQGPGFVPGNAATINPNAPFAAQIRRSANGRLNNNGSFLSAFGVSTKGAVLTDFVNIASRDVSGLEYTATYVWPTADWGRFTFTTAANQFLKYDQVNAPGQPTLHYAGRFVSTVGSPISPGSIPKWKSNTSVRWNWKNFTSILTFNHIAAYQDDPLFVLSPKMLAFYQAGTPKSDPAFSAYLADSTQLKVGGYRKISAFDTWDAQVSYKFSNDNQYTAGLTVSLSVVNLLDKLAPYAAGAFNDSYDTRTANNIGRFVQMTISKQF